MRGRLTAAGLVLGVLLSAGAAPAWAADPVDAGGAAVRDEAGVLSSADEQRAESAISATAKATGAHLTVVLVGTFTNPSDGRSWARATAEASGLGAGDLVLAIATTSRQVYWLPNSDFPVSESRVDAVGNDDLRPKLAAGDWTGGIVAFAQGLASGSGPGSASGSASGSSSSGGSGGGGGVAVLVLVLLALAAVVVVAVVVRRRRRAAAADAAGQAEPPIAVQPPTADQADLERRASRGLVALDDALTTSDQELGFAVAEFGDDATAPFRTALEDARGSAREAFGIRQRLDDDVPETPAERRAMTERIVALVDAAQRGLADQKAAFDELRGLERRLPVAVAAADADRSRLTAEAGAAGAVLQRLAADHGEAAARGALDDLGQANDLLAFAGTALDSARSPDAGGGGQAAVALRGAQQALGQARVLLDGVAGTPDQLLDAVRRLGAALDDARRDLAEARSLTASAGPDRVALETAARELDAAVRSADDDAPSVVLGRVEHADAELDTLLARTRDRQAQAAHAREALPRAIDAAERSIDAATRFIDTRRGGVGADARTRLAEAQRLLTAAVGTRSSDPGAALEQAQRAQLLADQAADLARQDVDDFRSQGPFGGGYGGGYGGGPFGGGGYGGGLGGVVAGAALGGILGGILNGGDRGYGGGWGGGGWGGDVGGVDAGGGWGGGGSWGDGGGGGFGGGDQGGGGGGF